MQDFKNGVPFNPGYECFYTAFPEDIYDYIEELKALKSPHKLKFEFSRLENQLKSIIFQIAGLYHGCMLWAGFLYFKFKSEPKKITGNLTLELSEDELKTVDYSKEVDFIFEFIEKFDKDTKYFLRKPFVVDEKTIAIIKDYKEFVNLNNQFKGLSDTKLIKLPKSYLKLEKLTDKQLDDFYQQIQNSIASENIKDLYNIGF